MPVPVLVGIGHEVDRGLLDEVAHLSLPTPTAVAHHIRGAVVSNARAAHAAIEAVRAGAQAALARAETGVAKARADARERGRAGAERAAEAVRAGRRALEPDARRLLDAAAKRIAAGREEARRAAAPCDRSSDRVLWPRPRFRNARAVPLPTVRRLSTGDPFARSP
jgi:exodeoxyribonuclease VII large subunit